MGHDWAGLGGIGRPLLPMAAARRRREFQEALDVDVDLGGGRLQPVVRQTTSRTSGGMELKKTVCKCKCGSCGGTAMVGAQESASGAFI